MAGYEYRVKDMAGPSPSASLDIQDIWVDPTSLTTADVRISKVLMSDEPDSYHITFERLDEYGIVDQTNSETFNVVSISDEPIFTITGLTAERKYDVTVVAYKGSSYGTPITDTLTMTSAIFNGKVIGGESASNKLSVGKAYMSISAPVDKNKFAVATRTFNAINVPTYTSANLSAMDAWTITESRKSFDAKYYSFGTSLFFDSIITDPKLGGGIGFFTNTEGTSGYFMIIESTSLSASQDRKSIRFVKADGTKLYPLKDSQASSASTFDGLYGGIQYNIDIKVKISGTRMDMIAYINGYKITVSDETGFNDNTGSNYVLYPTQNVSLLGSSGTVSFDYAYGTDITPEQYNDSSYQLNFYQGQFSNDLLNTTYGDIVYSGNYSDDVFTKKQAMVDEFGTTVREITKVNVKFPSRPSFPVKWSTGNNMLAKILGSKVSNFSGEAYVLNNASTTIPLSDNYLASFSVFGNTLAPSGQLEYTTDEVDTYSIKEPVVFESKWLQSLSDVKSLADWIKGNIINKGKTVNMNVFGNPLISVGDIISINYPYQGLAGTEKFIVTNINHTFDQGLSTSITCRLLVN